MICIEFPILVVILFVNKTLFDVNELIGFMFDEPLFSAAAEPPTRLNRIATPRRFSLAAGNVQVAVAEIWIG
jgi:hypothetical protein